MCASWVVNKTNVAFDKFAPEIWDLDQYVSDLFMIPFDSESLALILFFYIIICKLELYTDGSARQFS